MGKKSIKTHENLSHPAKEKSILTFLLSKGQQKEALE